MSTVPTQRRLAAILAADVVGYSRLMGQDEAGTLAALKALRTELLEPKIAEHSGRVFKSPGDGCLAEFPSVVNAVSCAVAIQQKIRRKVIELCHPTSHRDQCRRRCCRRLAKILVDPNYYVAEAGFHPATCGQP